jgi:hypothetical protein
MVNVGTAMRMLSFPVEPPRNWLGSAEHRNNRDACERAAEIPRVE